MNGLARESAQEMAGYSLHMADSGTDNFDRDFALSLLSSDQDAIYEIEEALKRIEKNTFPGFQGTPCLNNIAAKAVFFKEMLSAEYHDRQFGIVENAKALARACVDEGLVLSTGGTDNHLMLIDVRPLRLTGRQGADALCECGVLLLEVGHLLVLGLLVRLLLGARLRALGAGVGGGSRHDRHAEEAGAASSHHHRSISSRS